MPDPNEIAAAAERVRLIRAGEPLENFYDDPPWDAAEDVEAWREFRLREDHRILVDYALAHLDEHAEANPKHADHCRLSYDALCAILGRKHDRDYQDGDIGWESPDMGPCVVATMRDPITITGMFDGTNTVPITTCGELRAFCVLAGWNNQERGASRGE